jgi:hemolysin activation/secretion protein
VTEKLQQATVGSTASLFFLLIANLSHAAQPPLDAGRLLEGVKPPSEIGPPSSPPSINVVPDKPPALRDDSVQTVLIQGFRITGNSVYSEDVLRGLIAENIGKQLNLAQLQGVSEVLTRYYRQHGYLLARAYLPPQELRDGIVTIDVLEGRVGEIRVNKQGSTRISQATIDSFLSSFEPGRVLNQNDLERSLLLLDELPQVQASVTLVPGKSPGTSDLIVEVSQGKLATGSVELDNYGSRFTGRERLSAAVSLNDVTGRGDLITLRATTTGKGLSYGRAAYELPLNGRGTRLGAAYSYLKYELKEEFASLDVTGDANVYSLYATHPFTKTRLSGLTGQLKLDRKELSDRIGAVASEVDKTAVVLSAGFDFYQRDGIGGGGLNTLTLAYDLGSLDIRTAEARAIDAVGRNTDGKFGKLNLSATRLQYLAPNLSLYLAFSAQRASRNLDSSEKFGLGGAYAVRAYPQGEVSGDHGYLATVEVRWNALSAPSGNLMFYGFFDSGKVWINRNSLPADLNNQRTLSGAGIGLTWSRPNDYLLRAAYAHKLKANDRDDGADGRALFQAVKSF